MTDRVKILIQKRTSLKSQITNIKNLLKEGKLDNATLKLRIARLTDLYQAFEEYNDELEVLDPDQGHQDKFINIQECFYALASKAENILNTADASTSVSGTSNSDTRNRNVNNTTEKRRIKLPEAPLPTFDGKFENWLSFKNAFHAMVGSRTDLSDVDKLYYLKSALKDEAASKIRIFAIDGTNYANAWELLERSYEVKRILISRHLALILNMSAVEKENTNGLSKLADDMQQHLASLNALGVSVGSEMCVHILESKLPKNTVEKWEASLERDEFPKLEQLYEFLYKTAVCASRRERARIIDSECNEPPNKRKRGISSNQAFLTNTPRNCIACKAKRHPLYLCDKFKTLSVPKRIEMIKGAKLCYNCLRSHRDKPCKFSNCTICQRKHNTLLHYDKYANASKTDTSKPTAVNSE